jgi:hypothetical protein
MGTGRASPDGKRDMRTVTACLAAGSAAAVLALTACGGTPASTTTPATAAAAPANPVTVLKATGATPPPGTVYGTHDVYGDRMASGSFPDGDSVTVYASGSTAAFQAEENRVSGLVDDDTGVVVIPRELTVIIIDAYHGLGNGSPAAAVIAAKVHGLVITPGGSSG